MLKRSSSLFVFFIAISSVALGQASTSQTDKAQKESPAVTKLMGYSKKEAGKVWRDEVTDERLFKLFDLADTKKEGVVTKEQLLVAAKKLEAEQPQDAGRREGGPGERGGFGGGPGGFGGGRGGRPQVGVLMPTFIQDELKLSDAQRQQLSDLQKEVDAKLNKILTDEQQKQYQELKNNPGRGGPNGRGPGGRGGQGPGAQQ